MRCLSFLCRPSDMTYCLLIILKASPPMCQLRLCYWSALILWCGKFARGWQFGTSLSPCSSHIFLETCGRSLTFSRTAFFCAIALLFCPTTLLFLTPISIRQSHFGGHRRHLEHQASRGVPEWVQVSICQPDHIFGGSVRDNSDPSFPLFVSRQSALVVGLLWIKVLGFLQVINKQMATFISSLFGILSSIRYFGVVLLIVLLMFGDSKIIGLFHWSLRLRRWYSKLTPFFCVVHSDAYSGCYIGWWRLLQKHRRLEWRCFGFLLTGFITLVHTNVSSACDGVMRSSVS